MFNYILPPIIIIVSVSVLIMFLFRKAEQIPAQDLILDGERKEEGKKSAKLLSVIGQFGLKFLERLMHKSKLMSLKFHNLSNEWFQTIREKRQHGARLQKEELEKKVQNSHVKEGTVESREDTVFKQDPRPMVRDSVTMPQRQVRMKERNKLEEALIKRIAVNPRDIEAYERLGDYYLENENFQDSLECFKQVLRLSPSHHKARTRIRRLERMK